MSASRARSRPSSQKPTPADLVVTVKFAQVVNYKNSSGIQCYSPRPIFTIKNTGQTTAKGFDYVIEWKLNPNHVWQMYTGGQNITLAGGATKTIDGNNPVWDQPWCVNETNWKPGWRIKADTKNVVTESNENNNVAEKIYTPLAIPQTVPPRTMKKRYQKTPIPR
jgi:hypothetical protein